MHAIVTGSTGFFGRHLVRELTEQGWTVTAVVRATSPRTHLEPFGVSYLVADLATDRLTRDSFCQADVVFHAAGVLSDWAPWSHFVANTVEATRRLCEVIRCRLVHISSVSVYGRPHTTDPIDESRPFRTIGRWNYYMRTKIQAEQIVLQAAAKQRFEASIIRPAIMYGTGDHHVLAGVIESLRRGKVAFIGDPNAPLPLVDVRDVACGAILAACSDRAVGEAFNMVSAETISQREYFNTIAALIGALPVKRRLPYRLAYAAGFTTEAIGHLLRLKAVPLTRHRVSLFGHRRIYSIEKSRRLLGWEPRIRFHDGIREAVAWQLEHESALNAAYKP